MAEPYKETENTELIDVGDIAPSFDDELPPDEGIESMAPAGMDTGGAPVVAGLKERFAAFFVDVLFLYIMYWPLMLAYRTAILGKMEGPIPFAGWSGIVFHAVYLLLALLWFIAPEFSFGWSVGKLFCRLSVRSSDGQQVSFMGVLIRNLLKPLDLMLFPLLVTAAWMEWSPFHKRLGDLLGGTVVIRLLSKRPRRYDVSFEKLASASRRALAFLFDLALALAFIAGFALLLNPDAPLVSMLMLVVFPIVFLLFWLLPEWLCKTSPGKWLFGLSVSCEDGTSADMATSLVRTLWRLFDANIMGFMTMYLSARKQRPGDTAAGTFVIREPRSWQGLVILAMAVIAVSALVYMGTQNRDNFLSGDFQINFLPGIDLTGEGPLQTTPLTPSIRNFRFAEGTQDDFVSQPVYKPGDVLFFSFESDGYTLKGNSVWLQEDISVAYPSGAIALTIPNINEIRQELAGKGPVKFENSLALPANASAGRYTVTITVRDVLSKKELKEQRYFYVNPPVDVPKPGVEPAPPPIQPPPEDMPEAGDGVLDTYQ